MTTDESHNENDELRRRAKALCDTLDEIAELQVEVKQIKTDAKAAGYDMKAFNQVVKELRRGAEYQAAQLELELVVETYRKAVALPVTLEQAQAAVLSSAEELPDEAADRPARRRLGKGLEELRDDIRQGRVSLVASVDAAGAR